MVEAAINPITMSKIAMGIENTPTNHEYNGNIPKNISPPAINKYQY